MVFELNFQKHILRILNDTVTVKKYLLNLTKLLADCSFPKEQCDFAWFENLPAADRLRSLNNSPAN
jgi:hypothetical protein